jgi:glycosyltransferase involved in cell wall biosynthesis
MGNTPSILWLASWYPNRTDPFHGDFIERHAQAVSHFTKLTVMVVVKDEALAPDKTEVDKTVEGNLTVYRVYYGKSRYGGIIEKMISSIRYFRVQKAIYQIVEKEEGMPTIVHVHVAMKAGMLALWLKQQFNIPYVVTEHWTGYYPESSPNIYRRNFIYRYLTRKVFEKATLLLPVTDDLGKMIERNLVSLPYKVIRNTVNTSLFFYSGHRPEPFRFIHPSSMNYQKNPEGILQACKIVKDQGYHFQLHMVGNNDEKLVSLAGSLGLGQTVSITGTVPYEAVAKQMQQSSALLLFSRFENLPCVIVEALCCGLPVISSRVGGIAEVIDETNGILVESGRPDELAKAMIRLIENYAQYDRSAIAATASRQFNYNEIGKQFSDIYASI